MNQLYINILIMSAIYILIGLSFNIIFQLVKFYHFSHGITLTIAAYSVLIFHIYLNIGFLISIILSILATVIIVSLTSKIIFGYLRKRKSTSIAMLIASLGIYIFFQNLISLIFGNDIKTIRTEIIKDSITFFDGRITLVQIAMIVTAIVASILLLIFYKKNATGKTLQAVANDIELARYIGINTEKMILVSCVIGTALASIAGILIAFDVDMIPTMGMKNLLMGVVVMIVGGKKIIGIICASLLLSFAQNMSMWYVGSQWKDSVAFIILVLYLYLRPDICFSRLISKRLR